MARRIPPETKRAIQRHDRSIVRRAARYATWNGDPEPPGCYEAVFPSGRASKTNGPLAVDRQDEPGGEPSPVKILRACGIRNVCAKSTSKFSKPLNQWMNRLKSGINEALGLTAAFVPRTAAHFPGRRRRWPGWCRNAVHADEPVSVSNCHASGWTHQAGSRPRRLDFYCPCNDPGRYLVPAGRAGRRIAGRARIGNGRLALHASADDSRRHGVLPGRGPGGVAHGAVRTGAFVLRRTGGIQKRVARSIVSRLRGEPPGRGQPFRRGFFSQGMNRSGNTAFSPPGRRPDGSVNCRDAH